MEPEKAAELDVRFPSTVVVLAPLKELLAPIVAAAPLTYAELDFAAAYRTETELVAVPDEKATVFELALQIIRVVPLQQPKAMPEADDDCRRTWFAVLEEAYTISSVPPFARPNVAVVSLAERVP